VFYHLNFAREKNPIGQPDIPIRNCGDVIVCIFYSPRRREGRRHKIFCYLPLGGRAGAGPPNGK